MKSLQRVYKILPLLLVIPIIFSCSNSQNVKQYDELNTLKEYLENKEYGVNWTTEIEANRLEKELSLKTDVAPDVFVSPSMVSIIKKYQKPIYPKLITFGDLDTSQLPQEALNVIENFCSSLSENITSGIESNFKSGYYFNYIFFIHDLINKWEKVFKKEFPQKNLLIENPEKSENQKDEQKKVKNELFTRWILGKPEISENMMLVPVRFYCNAGRIDVIIYQDSDSDYKIYQIEIKELLR